MRLRHVKLAGFKSFADPATVALPGQLVGVVGPNGCGKSNIVDAVRWVLGESHARHLRGETMQDVIFNGTTQRPGNNRASVELIFDNSLGRAGGQWGQYAEIAVKRVLERDGESSYHINNLHVRRRDVTDIFMGTGLGPRAYAIIEQGMISRIIDSKPEELRVFLEEAAGVSKYKERRRETELRLADTRTNLSRTEDILRELDGQLARLGEQYEVARRYEDLHKQSATAQHLLWLLRKREAGNARERHARELTRSQTELEQETARLRDAERRLEEARQAHFSASDHLHAAQGGLYEVNAEAARLEQQLSFFRENRRRVETQVTSLGQQTEALQQDKTATQRKWAELQAELQQADARRAHCEAEAARARESLPRAEQDFSAADQRLGALRSDVAQAEQALSIAETHRGHARRLLEQLAQRQARLAHERSDLVAPDVSRLQVDQSALLTLDQELDQMNERLRELGVSHTAAQEERQQAHYLAEASNAQVTKLEARLQALIALQAKLKSDEKVERYLAELGLGEAPRLWQCVTVTPGWEDAVEAVFGLRLNAVGLETLSAAADFAEPPAGVALFAHGAPDAATQSRPALTPLAHYVSVSDARAAALVNDWLREVYAAPDWRAALREVANQPAGVVMVSREGHVLTAHSATFFAPNADVHGVLTRRREIDALQAEMVGVKTDLEEKRARLQRADRHAQARETEAHALRERQAERQVTRHRAQMELARLTQLAEQVSYRSQQIDAELGDIVAQVASETSAEGAAAAAEAGCAQRIDELRAALSEAHQRQQSTGDQLARERALLQQAERAYQEARFAVSAVAERIANTGIEAERLGARHGESLAQSEKLAAELALLDESPHVCALDAALAARERAERALSGARQSLEAFTTTLQAIDSERLQAEQKLEPLRNAINDVRLKEQEARLAEAQFEEQLSSHNAVEQQLIPLLEKGQRASHLQNELNRLTAEIQALGAVNLAALSEFDAAAERKNYLDLQASDLKQAVETLENAVRRIDRETRELLRDTFEKVNATFSATFPDLFGGGRASITLTGEEILDAGLLVSAQPPGKKTTSIHLLSGGEKALTALALVFSLFQLNPAPFCVLDEVDAPLDDANTERFCALVKKMSAKTQFIFISHNKLTMEMAEQLIGITMQESGVSRVVAVDIEQALRMTEEAAA